MENEDIRILVGAHVKKPRAQVEDAVARAADSLRDAQ